MNRWKMLLSVWTIMAANSLYAQGIRAELLPQRHFGNSIAPGNYSGIAYLGDNRYAVVDDKAPESGFKLLELEIDSISGRLLSGRECGTFSSGRPNRDEEDIVFNPSDSTFWISGEKDNDVLEYKMDGSLTGRRLQVPDTLRKASSNYGLEALAYEPEQGHYWTTTERMLNNEPFHRLQRFDVSLQPDLTLAYRMDDPVGKTRRGNRVHGIPALCALTDGRLLVLEREFFITPMRLGSFVSCKIYVVDTQSTVTQVPLEKKLLAEWTTHLHIGSYQIANYEGMCLGPKLADGSQVLVLVADSQNRYRGVLKDWLMTIKLYL